MHISSDRLLKLVSKATLDDVDGILALGHKLFMVQCQGRLGLDWREARKRVTSYISGASNLVLVSRDEGGEVRGFIIVQVGKGPGLGLLGTIVAWAATDRSGMKLFRSALAWLEDRHGVKMLSLETLRIDARLANILRSRYGFDIGMFLWKPQQKGGSS